jgi:hypothetical protein
MLYVGTNSGVTVDGVACITVSWLSDTHVKCTVPAGTGKNKPVVVTVGGQTSDTENIFSYNGIYCVLFLVQDTNARIDPSVTSVKPTHYSTKGGAIIIINGKNFGPGVPVPKAYLLPYECTNVQNVTSKSLTCTIPEGSGTNIEVQVAVGDAKSIANPLFKYDGTHNIEGMSGHLFVYIAPHIVTITPSSSKKSGKEGVQLSGTSFGGLLALSRDKVTLSMDGVTLAMYL